VISATLPSSLNNSLTLMLLSPAGKGGAGKNYACRQRRKTCSAQQNNVPLAVNGNSGPLPSKVGDPWQGSGTGQTGDQGRMLFPVAHV
jgi:hypothetical protein